MLPQGCMIALQCCKGACLKLASVLSMRAGRCLLRICAMQKDLHGACGSCCGVNYLMPIIKHRPAYRAHEAAREQGIPVSWMYHRYHWCTGHSSVGAPARHTLALILLCLCSPSPSPPAMVPTLAPTPGSQGASQPVSTFRAVAPAQPGVCTVQYLQVSHCKSQPAQDLQFPCLSCEQAMQGWCHA